MASIRTIDSCGTWDLLHENGDLLGRIQAGKYLTFDSILGEFVETQAVVDGMALYAHERVMNLHDVSAYERGFIGRFGLHHGSFALFMGKVELDRIYPLRKVADAPDAATVA